MAYETQTAYAKRRGVTQQRISYLVKQGKLEGALVRVGKRWLINPEKADEILKETLDPANSSGADGRGDAEKKGSHAQDYAANRAESEFYNAALKKLEYDTKSENAVWAKDVKKAGFSLGRLTRDAVLNVPDRIAAIVTAEGNIDRNRETMYRALEEALEGLTR